MIWPRTKAQAFSGKVDRPVSSQLHMRERIAVSGWVVAAKEDEVERVGVFVGSVCVAETSLLSLRADVSTSLGLSSKHRCGFSVLFGLFDTEVCPPKASSVTLSVCAKLLSSSEWELIDEVKIQLSSERLDQRPYGVIVAPSFNIEVHRENIYSTGNPSPSASQECVDLIASYIEPTQSVLDIGCGIGAYGKELIARGYEWFGIEVFEHLCDQLAAHNMPHRKSDGGPIPVEDGAYDCGICIEVLEHIPDPHSFLKDITRVVKQRVVFSVPNSESISMLSPLHVVPWHLLEGDHKNFFSRYNFKALLSQYFRSVEVIDYGELPVKAPGGISVYNHLFAIADI